MSIEKYHGLNLPQLMDLMHDPVAPDPVSLFPETAVWLVVLAWVILVSGMVVVALVARWKSNAYRREALAELDRIERELDGVSPEGALAIASLLKRTALAAYDREDVAALTGKQWAEFLGRACNDDPEVARSFDSLSVALYGGGPVDSGLAKATRLWIRKHHA